MIDDKEYFIDEESIDEPLMPYGNLEELQSQFKVSRGLLDWARETLQGDYILNISLMVYRYDRNILWCEENLCKADKTALSEYDLIGEFLARFPITKKLIEADNTIRRSRVRSSLAGAKDLDTVHANLRIALSEKVHSERRNIEAMRSLLLEYAEQEKFKLTVKSEDLLNAFQEISEKKQVENLVVNGGKLLETEEA